MVKNIILVASVIASVALVSVSARPRNVITVDVADAVNRTVCPIVVEVDVDYERIPHRIKLYRCAGEAVRRGLPAAECCQHQHQHTHKERDRDRYARCVELHDTMKVFDKRTKEFRPYDVAVGCACMPGSVEPVPRPPEGPYEAR